MATPPILFDGPLISAHLARRPAGPANFVRDLVLADLEDRLGTLIRDFPRALIIGPDALTLPERGASASASFTYQRLEAFSGADDLANLPVVPFDLIVSVLQLQAVNDVPGYLARLRSILAPDGLLTIATLGGDTLTEVREAFLAADSEVSGGASARVAPMIQVRDGGGLLQRAGLALPVADLETHVVRYGTPFALMAELKALGAANPLADRSRRFTTRTVLAAAATAYASRDADADGRVRATLDIIWLSGWAPHENQQKPLKPGSATSRLGDVLGKGG